MGKNRDFFRLHQELMEVRERSETWQQVKRRYRLEGLAGELYLVRGDNLGDEEDLLVDVLARGSASQTSDVLARRLFLELSADLRQVVRNECHREMIRGTRNEYG